MQLELAASIALDLSLTLSLLPFHQCAVFAVTAAAGRAKVLLLLLLLLQLLLLPHQNQAVERTLHLTAPPRRLNNIGQAPTSEMSFRWHQPKCSVRNVNCLKILIQISLLSL